MGEEADDIAISLGQTTEEAKDYYTVKEKFESHFFICIKRNLIFERVKFYLRSLKDNKSVDNFFTFLCCLTECCEFGTLKDDLIGDNCSGVERHEALEVQAVQVSYWEIHRCLN